jgi:hypothetical protein
MKLKQGAKERIKKAIKSNSFVVPENVRKAAAKGLELRKKFNRGGLSPSEASEQGIRSGVNTANALVGGRIGLALLKDMRDYLTRHAGDADAKGDESRGYWGKDSNPSAGWIAHHLWGAAAAKAWINSLNIE